MRCGEVNLRCMELLDTTHYSRFGNPEPTPVSNTLKKGPAIVVSGHDLLDLEELLKQTAGTGIQVYTHGEMLPAHAYPGLKKYPHLAGHYGTAWQNQQLEFDGIPAAVLFITNCIQRPGECYLDRTFTSGLVAGPGVSHVTSRDISPVMARNIDQQARLRQGRIYPWSRSAAKKTESVPGTQSPTRTLEIIAELSVSWCLSGIFTSLVLA